MALIEMEIDSVRRGLLRESWAIILKEKADENKDDIRYLPIYVSKSQADMVSRELLNNEIPHLTEYVISPIGLKIKLSELNSLIINRFDNNIFYSKLKLCQNGGTQEIDCQLSEGVALSIVAEVPIFVETSILDKVGTAVNRR